MKITIEIADSDVLRLLQALVKTKPDVRTTTPKAEKLKKAGSSSDGLLKRLTSDDEPMLKKLVLVDRDTGKQTKLLNNMIIDRDEIGRAFVVAVTADTYVGAVHFHLEGVEDYTHIEYRKPYYLHDRLKTNDKPVPWLPSIGSHTLTARLDNHEQLTVTFEVIGTRGTDDFEQSREMPAYREPGQ